MCNRILFVKDLIEKTSRCGKYLSEVCTTVRELACANEKCGSCLYFKHCLGGCRAVALTLTGDKMGVDLSKCLFFGNGYYEKIEALMEGWNNLVPMDKNIIK